MNSVTQMARYKPNPIFTCVCYFFKGTISFSIWQYARGSNTGKLWHHVVAVSWTKI